MAASDQNYRNQHTLDIVFAVSSTLMLVSIIGMFAQDYFKEFKVEQRSFRDVESAIAQRLALEDIPNKEEFDAKEKLVNDMKKAREDNADKIRQIRYDMRAEKPKKELSDSNYQAIKADLDSKTSFFNIMVEEHGLKAAKETYDAELKAINEKLEKAKAERDGYDENLKKLQRELTVLEEPLTKAESEWKKVNDKFETQAKLAIAKTWGWGDFVRSAPVIDGFASPLKIHQFTIYDVPIDYNFKQVPRYDRCMTCHQGIDRPTYTKDMLLSLKKINKEQEAKLEEAKTRLTQRKNALSAGEAKNVPNPNHLVLTELSEQKLSKARVNEYCAHPRLELFVGANSKHPAEKFGCTSCHAGQGSGTEFTLASHTPNSAPAKKRWKGEHNWEAIHMWDFPMLPMRFIESSCLKCHHEVTDLISSSNRIEAPKLVRGYNLIKENGCFGCHEIQGRKGGRQVGPDLRLESIPPLENLTGLERTKVEADLDNLPGNQRKVGPSLYRLAEKTNKEWTVRWLKAPREFRPDTKMPHFYGLANNNEAALKGTEQEKFPDAEIQAIAHYLFATSNSYREELTARHKDSAETKKKDQDRLEFLQNLAKLSDKEKTELADVQKRVNLRKATLLVDLAPNHKGDVAKGRQLFAEKGCLACHSHQGTETASGAVTDQTTFSPGVISEAQFGPNLSQVAAKLGSKEGDKASARNWLIQWIMDPHVHSPRSRMPVTHLDAGQAADIAAWLLAQKDQDTGSGWGELAVAAPDEKTLKALASVYLTRLLPRDIMKDLLDGKIVADATINDLPQEEQELANKKASTESLQFYLGKKAVSRLGCYACHDIPGFDSGKPIGVGLNDWGKKDAERLAFEDIAHYFKDHYEVVDSLIQDGKPVGPKMEGGKKKLPYEKFFAEALAHHSREGFLNQKLQEPRSYDHNRILTWDDRARMPQFKFARLRQNPGESAEDYEARSLKEEADAREAVMTFVLGLVAEPVPQKSINQPSGDRLAEVKGRQILDKYNCGGCHLLRPGVFEFKLSSKANDLLDGWYDLRKKDFDFPAHTNWHALSPPAPDRVMAFSDKAALVTEPTSLPDNPEHPVVKLLLSRSVRFPSKAAAGEMRDIPSNNKIQVPPEDMIYPPLAALESEEKLREFLRVKGPYGGTFANLMVNYLLKKNESIYKDVGEAGSARVALPPQLVSQGERTQPEWLYEFLLDPQPIRPLRSADGKTGMTILRMPRFNLSKEEATALVAYFAAVERIQNPGTPLSFPQTFIVQQQGLNGDYWKLQNARYIARMKEAKVGGKSYYSRRVDELTPIWNQVEKDFASQHAESQAKLDALSASLERNTKERDKAKEAKLAEEFANLDKMVKDEENSKKNWLDRVERLKKQLDDHTFVAQKKSWEEKDAYILDAYRLVTTSTLCLNCHRVGELKLRGATEGPPLAQVHKRLRPGWALRWIASPDRFVTHDPVMLVNFKPGAKDYQDQFLGSSEDQYTASRDILMAFPAIEALPAVRYLAYPLPGDKK